jgi:hypothetical protein
LMRQGKWVSSQFPLWDFVQCNWCADEYYLFFTPPPSQFPFWDFVQCNNKVPVKDVEAKIKALNSLSGISSNECNLEKVSSELKPVKDTIHIVTLNSLSGISSNEWATLRIYFSQFPFWDFVQQPVKPVTPMSLNSLSGISSNECNIHIGSLNSLSGISSNATKENRISHNTLNSLSGIS